MPQLKVQNLYSTTITEVGGIPASGDCDFTVATPPINTNGFIIISPENTITREIMYYHNVIGSRIYVRAENRFSPKVHTSTEIVKMNDVAEIFNTFSDMISQAFYVEKTGGLTIKVWGGYVYYNGAAVAVPDTNLTLVNGTNYIKYNYPTNTVSVDLVNSGNIKVAVTVLAGVITSIVYRNAKESYIDSIGMQVATYDPAGIAQQVAGLTATQTFSTGLKTFLSGMFALRNVANTFSGLFTNTNTADRTYTLQDSSDTLVGRATTDTLTNKTLYASTNVISENTTTASSATPTPTGGSLRNYFTITALATAPTFSAPSGSPIDGNLIMIRIKDNGTARIITWNAIYRGGDTTLPTTTIISKTMFLLFVYNSADSKWDLVSKDDNH